MQANLDKPMSFEEVRRFLGRGKTWLYEQLQTGKLPAYKLGGRWIVYPNDLRRYLAQQPSNQKKLKRAAAIR